MASGELVINDVDEDELYEHLETFSLKGLLPKRVLDEGSLQPEPKVR